MSPVIDNDKIEQLADALEHAASVLFITGAGISADSGLPTYRGVGGLYDGVGTEDGMPIEVALSGSTFEAQPELTWKYITQVEAACRGAKPNRAHEVIAQYQFSRPRAWVLTQNVDGFHGLAGSKALMEIHGNLRNLHCTQCGWSQVVENYRDLGLKTGELRAPVCCKCGGVIRPNVVLFGEMLPIAVVEALQAQLALGFDVVVSIGTSSGFPYIQQPVMAAKEDGRFTVEINPAKTELSDLVDLYIPQRALPTFEALAQKMGL